MINMQKKEKKKKEIENLYFFVMLCIILPQEKYPCYTRSFAPDLGNDIG